MTGLPPEMLNEIGARSILWHGLLANVNLSDMDEANFRTMAVQEIKGKRRRETFPGCSTEASLRCVSIQCLGQTLMSIKCWNSESLILDARAYGSLRWQGSICTAVCFFCKDDFGCFCSRSRSNQRSRDRRLSAPARSQVKSSISCKCGRSMPYNAIIVALDECKGAAPLKPLLFPVEILLEDYWQSGEKTQGWSQPHHSYISRWALSCYIAALFGQFLLLCDALCPVAFLYRNEASSNEHCCMTSPLTAL